MIPGIDCQSVFNLSFTAVRVQFELRRFADTHRLPRIYMVLRCFIQPSAGYLTPEVAGLGGTNLHQRRNELFAKHNLLIMKDLCFATP